MDKTFNYWKYPKFRKMSYHFTLDTRNSNLSSAKYIISIKKVTFIQFQTEKII